MVIISDDNTRRTPTKRIVPLILDELNRAGIPDSAVSIVISSGTHRAMTPPELDQKYGPAVLSRVPIIPHRYKEPSELVDFGTTSRGIPSSSTGTWLRPTSGLQLAKLCPTIRPDGAEAQRRSSPV